MSDTEYAPDCGAIKPDEECGECRACEEAEEAGRAREIEGGIFRDEPGTTL
ncbi:MULTISPECIES: hypothetical protein [Streptomyces]|uniref:hypothetical protein n=1 Tax=Streptomyces TaxID=1883 RepID=UPI00073E007D|nr:hypothetical protein [Streptomyces sp. FBKL.4005]MYU28640.1 hypothetical protein [Streptomyces sp. SID7810]CUW29679.1 hypothetical protein TUE45_04388 [Streptomyces reticuli]